jgi:hypothetical protein
MARDFNGTSDRIAYAYDFDWSAVPQTWAAWTWWDNFDASEQPMTDHQAGDTLAAKWVERVGTETSVRMTFNTTGSLQSTQTDTGYLSTGSWMHMTWSWNGSVGNNLTDTLFYKNGELFANVNNTSGTGTPNACAGSNSLGARLVGASPQWFDGRIAEQGRWNRQLTTDEIAALGKGYSPLCFPAGLKQYRPLLRDTGDRMAGVASAVDGTTVIQHPNVIMPRKTLRRVEPPSMTFMRQRHFRFRTDTAVVDASPTWGGDEDAVA